MASPTFTFLSPDARVRTASTYFVIGKTLSYPGKREGEMLHFLKLSVTPGPKRVPDEGGVGRPGEHIALDQSFWVVIARIANWSYAETGKFHGPDNPAQGNMSIHHMPLPEAFRTLPELKLS